MPKPPKPKKSPDNPLAPLLSLILQNNLPALRALLKKSPALATITVTTGIFIREIRHQLYVGDTPLHLAAAALRPNIIKFLLKHHANPTALNRRGHTPLHYASDPRPNSTLDRSQQAATINTLLAAGANPNTHDKNGATPLHRAVRSRSPMAVKTLLQGNADPNAPLGKKGSTPLHLATQSTGASNTGNTQTQQAEIIRLLLAHHANPHAQDSRNKSPLDWSPNPTITALLQDRP